MYFEIEKQAIDAINKALDQYDEEIDRNFKLEFPPNPDLGDLASTIAFALTKKLKTSPPEVAKELVEKIEVPEIFSKVQNFGPYVNFFRLVYSAQNNMFRVVASSFDYKADAIQSRDQLGARYQGAWLLYAK